MKKLIEFIIQLIAKEEHKAVWQVSRIVHTGTEEIMDSVGTVLEFYHGERTAIVRFPAGFPIKEVAGRTLDLVRMNHDVYPNSYQFTDPADRELKGYLTTDNEKMLLQIELPEGVTCYQLCSGTK